MMARRDFDAEAVTIEGRSPASSGGLFYRHAGPGGAAPAMVHLHGFATSGASVLPTAALLTDRFDTYVPDLPGHGRSPGPRPPLGLFGMGDEAVRFLDAVGVERATFVGNSLGCAVLARMAARYPDRVERLILVSPAGGPHNRPLWRGIAQLAYDGILEPPTLLPVALRDYARFGPVNSIRLFAQVCASPPVRILKDVAVPTLVVMGARDPLLPHGGRVRGMAAVADRAGNTSAVVIHGAAHAVNFSHPEVLAATIRAYWNDPTLSAADDLPAGVEVIARAAAAV